MNKTTKRKTKKKFKTIYLVPVIFLLIVAVVGLSVFQSLFQNGPIYGERCAGVTEIDSKDLDAAESAISSSYSSVNDLLIEVNCKTIAVDVVLKSVTDKASVSEICDAILAEIDDQVGLSKSNSDSKYSDLFGTYNCKTQYHVDFTIEGEGDIFPIFASKHPSSDEVNYTYNTAVNQALVDQLTQAEE